MEHRLYEQNKKVVRSAHDAVDAAKKLEDAPTGAQRFTAQRAAEDLLSDLDAQRARYDDLVTEGVKRAEEWEREHP